MREDPRLTDEAASAKDAPEQAAEFPTKGWIEALRHVAQHYRLPMSIQRAWLVARWSGLENDRARIRDLARGVGLRVKFAEPKTVELSSWQLPLIVQLRHGQVGVVTSFSKSGEAAVMLAGSEGLQTPMPIETLLQELELVVIPRPVRAIPDERVDTYIRPYEENWLRRIILRDLRPYGHVMVASLIANCLGLAGILFSMQVYDRVVPSESFPTLYVLFSGVLLAICFDFIMRRMRMGVIDLLGKRTDLLMSDRVMGHALRVRNQVTTGSAGTFIAQLRDLEKVREMLTSTTVGALADIPFFLLFLAVFWSISGILVLVPIGALLLMVIPGLLAQRKLRAYAQESMREAALRNAMLVEAIQGIEDIKTLQAEERFEQQWNHVNAVTGEAQIKLRSLTNTLSVWTHNVQMAVYAVTVFLGAPMVIAGDMSTGALVAASILGSRMMAPMAQVTQIMSRFQQAKVAANSLNQIMKLPIDHPDKESRIHSPLIAGKYKLKSATFRYGDDSSPTALSIRDLEIQPGEKIAVLGKNGAGKSTLLQALSGLLVPSAGEILLDDVALRHIDPADVRRDVGLLTQNARLFHGTLRDNIMMGAPQASQEEILRALSMVGAEDFVRKLPKGLDHMVLEGGYGLSGGQKQAILLARLLIRQPNVVLLDEPTASMDEAAERHFIRQFRSWSKGSTVVIATHRMRILELVDRIIVIENGLVALDDSKERALLVLRGLADVKPAGGKRRLSRNARPIQSEHYDKD
ncbi:ATP-binding cassette subfamily C protein LapB [Mesorhizobium sp. J18]|uniref:type I secretion system permease/ATPase n=1 Tax=Mesorhizobium sp. J18 TaxID=935263 RepID=UPI0011998737|nr:type I secretion system permease/ATPase [Mesorhizobium sp. J18]TWG99753.1 ATP-binding cassette subfamily C protein LapB [Mesorhizobium sp. J18]